MLGSQLLLGAGGCPALWCLMLSPLNGFLPPQYFILLLLIFLLEIIAGVLAYVYYQQVRGAWTSHGGHDTSTPAAPVLTNLPLGLGGGVWVF